MRSGKAGWCTVVAMVLSCPLASAADESPIGRKIDNFSLRDYRGKLRSLDEFGSAKLVVVAFVGAECPLARLYAPRLQELQQQFADQQVAFVGVDANRQDSITEVAAYARQHGIEFPLLVDAGNQVADVFGAERTPEVFVLDSERKVRYHGRIDDQYGQGASSGYARPKVNARDLAQALTELLAGKEVSVPLTEAKGCIIGRVPKVDAHGEVTYCNQIARLLQDRCVSCHRPGEIAPFPLEQYDEVVGWADMMREVIGEGRMPPWFADPAHGKFANDARLTDDQKKLFNTWVDNGCPQGDRADLPEPRQWVTGWQIPEPDQVIYMSDEPYTVPAEGVVEYQYFTVDPGWTEDKWVQAAEARPDNRAVVHHIITSIVPPGEGDGFGRSRGGLLGGYAPGGGVRVSPPGVATFVPAGSKLRFQMHYTPNGSVQKDRSLMGVVFADPKTVHKRMRGGTPMNHAFAIPPGDPHYQVTSEHKFDEDMDLVWLAPHMHLRGSAFRYEAAYPDGQREILLDVPKYDFNWQIRYLLAEPKRMPAGTTIHCTAHFDNSAENLANPDPTATVTWGDQTWEEMMIGWFGSVSAHEDLQAPADEQVPAETQAAADKQAEAEKQSTSAPQ
ncbi:MAG: redoxin domain-containing protein [Pirellulales bacterium]